MSSFSTEATILVEHDDIESIEASAVALVEWLTKERATRVWVTVKDKDSGAVHSVLVEVDTLAVVATKPHGDTTNAAPGDLIFWIVDEHGATFAFADEALARAHADAEKRRGAVALVLFPTDVPAPVVARGVEAVADWAASNAEPDERAEYLTGNAADIAERDAEGETPAGVVADMLTRDDASADEIARAAVEAYRSHGLREHLVAEAASLLDEPSHVTLAQDYVRGMVEVIIRACGLSHDEHTREVVAQIRARVEASVRR